MRPPRSLATRGGSTALALLACASLAGACSRDARSARLAGPSPSDELYRIECEDTIAACRAEASARCGGRYQVLESTGAPVEPPRVTSAPGPRSTGPRYQRLKWVGMMIVACGDAPEAEAASASEPPSAKAAAPAAPATVPADRICIPGVTQECLGPAACRGAQACLPDGNGYGPCDCGSASSPGAAGADAGAAPHGDPGG